MVRNFADSDNEILYPEENSKTTSSAIWPIFKPPVAP
jgi:hypothetical protein